MPIHNHRLFLSPIESNALKGIALLLLLWHHLFYIPNGLYSDFHIHNSIFLINSSAKAAKICVALFVLLSGYGLTAASEKTENLSIGSFLIHRTTKLFPNYWLMWILFVPVGFLFFDLSLDTVYGSHPNMKLIIDVIGLSYICGYYGVNPTWWFYSCIIILYLLFPLFLHIFKSKYRILPLLLLLFSIYIIFHPIPFLRNINGYVFPFILGIALRIRLINSILPPPRKFKHNAMLVSICT